MPFISCVCTRLYTVERCNLYFFFFYCEQFPSLTGLVRNFCKFSQVLVGRASLGAIWIA